MIGPSMTWDSPLTHFQQRVSSSVTIDLSTGYPQLRDPTELWHHYVRVISSFQGSKSSYSEEAEETAAAAREILGLDSRQEVLFTSSGSIALARTLVAVADGRRALVTTPGFDSIYSLAAEATSQEPAVVLLDPFLRHDKWFERLLDSINDRVGLIIVVSPDNPSGLILSASEILELGHRCSAVDATLILDQSFALISPYGNKVALGTILQGSCKWCVLWDTSKVIELAGEKLGFVFPSSDLTEKLAQSFRVTQLELPLPTVRSIRTCLAEAKSAGELQQLNNQVQANYRKVAQTANKLSLKVNVPEAGSFLLLSTAGTSLCGGGQTIASGLLARHVAVAPSSILTLPNSQLASEFVRVGLAHSSTHIASFNDALTDLVHVVSRTACPSALRAGT